MTEDQIIAFCDALPGATREQPFGPEAEVWKLGGKIFAILALGQGRVSLKCPDPAFAEMLIETGRATRAPYLPRGGWIALPASDPDLAHRLTESHATIRASLPRRLRDSLG
ncbi:MmcQ/YjbR family DNA-binding protein [Rhodovulum steppense]|uniref:Putative DNA-binding protein (MmcQ/YjbR family) n=1 Tax=Rhodovulum steppense TaxID=540251 RepID=A0A4R1YUZ4_9RHOB|nr:MmcQ/YjbR family DNA-binding protein [Rhodovulum steppense]TCM84697.1 putative DNA-binding protein (MmcQ/YjbR family) [Rhodovulum steppense]